MQKISIFDSWKKKHQQFVARDSGLVVHKDYPYIAASPDLVVSCTCCGDGLCEIKCPFTCRDQVPSPDNWDHLADVDSSVQLKTNSQYFYQIQGQMACTGVKYCDFFVYTAHGHHLERISMDVDLWKLMLDRFQSFFHNHLAPEILTGSMAVGSCDEAHADHSYITDSGSPQGKPGANAKPGKHVLTAPRYPPVYLCGMCGLDCLRDPKTYDEHSIQCNKCQGCFHHGCLNVVPGEDNFDATWQCSYCNL